MSGPLDAKKITDDLVAPIFRLPSIHWLGGFLTAAGINGLLFLAMALYIVDGYGIFGVTNSINWGDDIGTYIYWIATAVAGTIVSAVLFVFRQKWRTGINRATEAMTIFAINIAGLFPLIHTGRPWVDYWLIPTPNNLSLWPQFKSPIMWDVFAISGYATCSVLFFYLGLLPDFATVRDRATRKWQKLLYGMLAMGWKGDSGDWNHYERAYGLFAWVATPLVVGMHSTLGALLAVAAVPGWHSTVFPPYFVSGAVFGGVGMAFVILVPMRKLFSIEAYITRDHLEKLSKILLAAGMVVTYMYMMEVFTAWWSEDHAELDLLHWRMTGPSSWSYWLMICANVLPIQLLWFKSFRRNAHYLFLTGILVNLGMWFERYNLMALTLKHGSLPSTWAQYSFTVFDYMVLAGSFGMFFTQYLLFTRIAPMVSIAEVKSTLLSGHKEGAHV